MVDGGRLRRLELIGFNPHGAVEGRRLRNVKRDPAGRGHLLLTRLLQDDVRFTDRPAICKNQRRRRVSPVAFGTVPGREGPQLGGRERRVGHRGGGDPTCPGFGCLLTRDVELRVTRERFGNDLATRKM